jgi:hypothetical protein
MTCELNLVFDNFLNARPYPNLVPIQDFTDGYGNLGKEFPYIVPLRLLYYAEDHKFTINTFTPGDRLPNKCFYPIGLGFFSFDVDYFSLISRSVLDLVRQDKVIVLFYYHEGDNPWNQKTRLDDLCRAHKLNPDCYRFVSGNTVAKDVPNFVYFADHELFYWRANKNHQALVWNNLPRSRKFTILNRTHKWWRATVMADLHRARLLDDAYWSYNTISIDDRPEDNPIRVDWFPGLANHINEFVAGAPYQCDDLDSDAHNRHHNLVIPHFRDSYFQIVLETMFDADQSGGTFLTEKTFKPIKHAQPFVLIAPPKSLATLRDLGYKTFDEMIINGYDDVVDNTQRWIHVRSTIFALVVQDLYYWADQCYYQCMYNQELFLASKINRLNKLCSDLN